MGTQFKQTNKKILASMLINMQDIWKKNWQKQKMRGKFVLKFLAPFLHY